ncbi:pirin family protein [Sulfurimonas sp. HSL-1716]|uniref:pirin family protein n=1 Tax=Hydrocurvibacter sulfurireducens TaxID=3131937 RepID=UPI0031F8EFDE
MLEKIEKDKMFVSNQGWLRSRFHFSFAEYRDYDNMKFGVLRVLNDDIVHPQSGFPMHPHRDMEIISYIVEGEMTHKDSMGNEKTLHRGDVQYMSAGEGIYHSEYNNHKTDDLRLLQIWILPPRKGLSKIYDDASFGYEERKNRLLHIVSDEEGDAKVKIHQNVNIYVCELDAGRNILHSIKENRQLYFVQIEGTADVNGLHPQGTLHVDSGDAIKITQESRLHISALSDAHFLFIEMKAH